MDPHLAGMDRVAVFDPLPQRIRTLEVGQRTKATRGNDLLSNQ